MSSNGITNIAAFVFGSDQVRLALYTLQTDGLNFESVWHLLGAIGIVLWGYYTNKPDPSVQP